MSPDGAIYADPTSIEAILGGMYPAPADLWSAPSQFEQLSGQTWQQTTGLTLMELPGGGFLPAAGGLGALASFAEFPAGEQAAAGIGFGAIIPFLMTLGRAAIPFLQKYWPQIVAAIGATAAGALMTKLSAGGAAVPGVNGAQLAVNGIPLGGPFAPEPPASMIVKEWAGIGGSRFYLLTNGRIAIRKANGVWKLIRRVKMIHMKSTNPRLGDIIKADRIIQRAVKVVRRRLPSARRK